MKWTPNVRSYAVYYEDGQEPAFVHIPDGRIVRADELETANYPRPTERQLEQHRLRERSRYRRAMRWTIEPLAWIRSWQHSIDRYGQTRRRLRRKGQPDPIAQEILEKCS